MHFEDGRDGKRATSEGLLPCRAFLPMSVRGTVDMSSGCVGEGEVPAYPPPSTVFLALRVTLKSHSANPSAPPSPGQLGMPRAVQGPLG